MKKFLWFLLHAVDSNWGYTTPIQERFEIGHSVVISPFKLEHTSYVVGTKVTIIETGRHDYLVEDINGVKCIVYQFELV